MIYISVMLLLLLLIPAATIHQRRRDGVPVVSASPAVRRLQILTTAGSSIILPLIFTLMLAPPRSWPSRIAAAGLVIGIGVTVVGAVRFTDLRKTIAAGGGMVCPMCLYPIGGSGRVTCPECGSSHAVSDVVELWERELLLERKTPGA